MNIHIEDKELFEKLKEATIVKTLIGSHLYGINNSKSDKDYLYIYATSENELTSVIKTHHQLQYKEDGVDHNFVSLHTFIENILNGDSTINFEIVNSKQLVGTDLEWLYNIGEYFLTYTVIRSYLGFARRDVKFFYKSETDYEKRKKLKHIIRGYIYARNMLDYEWDFEESNNELISSNIDIIDIKSKIVRGFESKISLLRKDLNKRLNDNNLKYAQKMSYKNGMDLTNKLLSFCKSKTFKNKQKILNNFDLSLFINSFENWVEY